jgi:ectoine hydroxylase-related dioxygenase (phytanoyl-CoA dioxygenase family)
MTHYQTDPNALNVPWVHSPFFEQLLAHLPLSAEQSRLARQYHELGYVVIEDPVVPAELIDRVVGELDGRYTEAATGYEESSRVMDAWRWCPAVAEIARAPRLLDTLSLLYQRRPIPFQTLNFAVGTEQLAHSDAIHFHSVPQRFTAGAWVALEDIDADSGPLTVYPGSHRLPLFDFHDLAMPTGFASYRDYECFVAELLEAKKIEPEPLLLRRGQAVIWAANLHHGGSAVADPTRTRLSQASHYYFEGGLYYQPGASDPFIGRMKLKDVEEVGTGRRIPNLYRGEPVSQSQLSARKSWRHRLRAVAARLGRVD